jgi:nitroreductase
MTISDEQTHLATTKIAKANYPIDETLEQRWSPLAFSDQPVESETLRQLFEAARWAASSFNEQPWSYIVATKDHPTEFDRLLDCLAEGNQEWAKQAPVLMISVAKLQFERNGNENRHAFHDVGAASANLAIQATKMGLYVHQMAGFDVEKVKATYGIEAGYEPVAAIAVGYLGNVDTLSDRLRQRELSPRTRKSLETFVFSGSWKQPAPITGTQ